MRVLVTGSEGRIGRHLAGVLARKGYSLRGFDTLADTQAAGRPVEDQHVGDLRNLPAVRSAMRGRRQRCGRRWDVRRRLVGWRALGAAGGALDANWWKSEVGISDEFVYEVGRLIEPGDSAIFVLVRTADPDYVDAQFRGYGGIVLRSSLTQEQSDKVQELLHGNVQSSVPA